MVFDSYSYTRSIFFSSLFTAHKPIIKGTTYISKR